MLLLAFEVDDFSQQRCCLCIFLYATESHHETLQGGEKNVILNVILIFFMLPFDLISHFLFALRDIKTFTECYILVSWPQRHQSGSSAAFL